MNKFWLVVIIFLVFGGYIIKTAYDINFSNPEDRFVFGKAFGKWLIKLGKNIKDTVGYAVKKEWLPDIPENKTNLTNTTKGD